jgi:anti-sigma regulatory factor (Ser/Thr protein kinase)
MDPTEIRHVRWAYTPALTTPTRARRRLADQLDAWGIEAPRSDSIVLVAHELVANAVDHASTDLELSVSFDGNEIIVEVHDQSTLEPRLQPLNPTAVRGRGLQMVDALAKSWHWILDAGGKTVRAVIIPELWSLTHLSLGRQLLQGAPVRPRNA